MTSGNRSGIVLVIENDRAHATALATHLEREGHRVTVEMMGSESLQVARALPPGLTVLDLALPAVTDFAVLRQLRDEHRQIPVLVLTSSTGSGETKSKGHCAGSHGPRAHACHCNETLGVLSEMIKKAAAGLGAARSATQVGDLTIDFAARVVYRNRTVVDLPPKEFDLLAALIRHRGAVVSRAQLLRDVWGYPAGRRSRTVETHIGTLREHLGDGPRSQRYIVTVPRAGYRFAVDEADERNSGLVTALASARVRKRLVKAPQIEKRDLLDLSADHDERSAIGD